MSHRCASALRPRRPTQRPRCHPAPWNRSKLPTSISAAMRSGTIGATVHFAERETPRRTSAGARTRPHPAPSTEIPSNGQGQAQPARRQRPSEHPDRPRPGRHQEDRRGSDGPAVGPLRPLYQDEELPLACQRSELPRLPSASRRAVRADLRHHRFRRRARPQDRRHHPALARPGQRAEARAGQQRRLRQPPRHAGRAAGRQQGADRPHAGAARDHRRGQRCLDDEPARGVDRPVRGAHLVPLRVDPERHAIGPQIRTQAETLA